MKIVVSKPRGGRMRVVLNDLRGQTGRYDVLEDVSEEGFREAVFPAIEAWEKRRKAIKDAKKG